ncbi:MAG: EscS/YscS/HrcS family type III secretion system export apparatus protein [Bdellovibrionales bacterium RIFOXYD12_FULL_39_22]|nr:MAG: EscS/YscS/HrcS family type III secretion system export apparatus protein [Bdellovibrionales bacterium RIFOXYB1_FULL_39_21]OFZ42837.1 MAG: EscS/YscS/HrcS family type III secretion system export apparatus protein [Bdellovibrionales bacterium RIFOXYC12_FULL_39_17]OFZ47503.1 MAG: EscS/YscS/HrcS family type III secretion system export apparatus protein [Bdellovibrionales bacterium RIFOXYC1_FULL_39_130]OFZ70856.1 MAG: EscS/YscS/HrcS family type III secretion system export apparatus protein [Bd
MPDEFVANIANQAIKVTLMISAPMLLAALFMGILVSLFQAVTQINEQTLSFIPKILVIVGALVICAPWMSDTITSYTRELYTSIPQVVLGK